MMKPLRRFWQALDGIPGVTTDAMEWRGRLEEEFDVARHYLRATGALAREVDCPSPGGDACPRRVVRLPGDRWRAVCGSRDRQCDALDLTEGDIEVLALDRARLATDLARAFGLTSIPVSPGRGRVIALGTYAIIEGVGSSAFLLLPGPLDALTLDDLQAAGVPARGAILIFSSRESVPGVLRGRLAACDHHLVVLSEVIGFREDGGLTLVQPVAVLLHPVRERLQVQRDTKSGGPVIALPPGTKWEKVTLTFKSSGDLECMAAGGVTRISPEQVGMSNMRNREPTKAWTLLLAMARANGRVSQGVDEGWEAAKKHKQELSKHLKRIFGMSDDPIPWDKRERAFVCRFVLRDDRPLSLRRREMAGRNFADQ